MTTATKKKVAASSEEEKIAFSGEYIYAVGRRKSATAQIRLYKKSENKDLSHTVNGRPLSEYFPLVRAQKTFLSPLEQAGLTDEFVVSAVIVGGGVTGQVEAARHGIARALVLHSETLRPVLKAHGFLRRDPRVVERKKPGLRKARRATQWRKR
ncbi:MAG TPA: 30S ribosomal protein S9 [Candidatus Moranbacteria bacterium]|nr:30S ribosomal protein S9 [Candidatus Moranbacteria bacterium]